MNLDIWSKFIYLGVVSFDLCLLFYKEEGRTIGWIEVNRVEGVCVV